MSDVPTISMVEKFAKAMGWSEQEVFDFFTEVNERMKQDKSTPQDEETMKKRAERLLNNLGMPSEYDGFNFFCSAIAIVAENPQFGRAMRTKVYPLLVQEYNTTYNKLDRELYHVFSSIWNPANIEALRKYFDVNTETVGRGSNSPRKLIIGLADKLRWGQA